MKRYFKVLIGLYAAALCICGTLRVILKLRYIDAATGFYSGGAALVLIFNILLALVPVTMFVSNRLKRVDGDYPVSLRDGFTSFIAILTGLSLLAYALFGMPEITLEQGRSAFLHGISTFMNLFLGVISGISFLYLGVCGVLGREKPPSGLLLLAPSIWQIVLLISRFNAYTTVTTISDHLLAVLFMVFNSLFLIGYSRTACGQLRKDGRNYTIPAGLCASLCGFLLVIPNYVYMFVYKALMPVALLTVYESIFVLVMSLYALLFVLWLIRSIRQV